MKSLYRRIKMKFRWKTTHFLYLNLFGKFKIVRIAEQLVFYVSPFFSDAEKSCRSYQYAMTSPLGVVTGVMGCTQFGRVLLATRASLNLSAGGDPVSLNLFYR